MEKFSFLPQNVLLALKNVDLSDIYEMRLRVGQPLFVNERGNWEKIAKLDRLPTRRDMEEIVLRLTEHSIYAHVDTMKQGYITTKNGIRVGICGECVKDGDNVKIIKNVTSLCIRVPHEIKGCANDVLKTVFCDGLKNLLIISPPGCGKTTMLREIVRRLSENHNVLVVDERLELSGVGTFDLGCRTDVLSFCTKEYGLDFGVKSMRPDVIAVDELTSISDVSGVTKAVLSGVFVIATAHGMSILDIQKKEMFSEIFKNYIFDYAVELRGVGEICAIKKLKDD